MSDVITNRMESLSNELLLDIFEYLDAYKLVKAFYGLNHRINILLPSTNLHIIFDSPNNDKIISNILEASINPSQIRLLISFRTIDINERFLSFITENLRVLYLGAMNRVSMNKILKYIPINNQIKSLLIAQECFMFDKGEYVYSFIDFLFRAHGHRFAGLVYLSIEGGTEEDGLFDVSMIFQQLRRLEIGIASWSLNILKFLQNNTPNLRSLKFTEEFETCITPSDIVFRQIHEFHVYCSYDLMFLQSLLSKFPCLRRLYIDCRNERWMKISDGTQWQDLIEKYLPHLQQLTIEFDQGIDEGILKTFHNRDFWSTKKVNVKMIVNKGVSRKRLIKTICIGQEWQFKYFDWCENQAYKYGPERTSSSSSRSSSPTLTPLRSSFTRRTLSSSSSSSQSRSQPSKRLRSSSTSESQQDSDEFDDHE